MIYKIFTIPYKPEFEYYNKSGIWYKRSKTDTKGWFRADANAQKVLNDHFKKQRRFYGWNYNTTTKLLAVTVLLVGVYSAYRFVNKK